MFGSVSCFFVDRQLENSNNSVKVGNLSGWEGGKASIWVERSTEKYCKLGRGQGRLLGRKEHP